MRTYRPAVTNATCVHVSAASRRSVRNVTAGPPSALIASASESASSGRTQPSTDRDAGSFAPDSETRSLRPLKRSARPNRPVALRFAPATTPSALAALASEAVAPDGSLKPNAPMSLPAATGSGVVVAGAPSIGASMIGARSPVAGSASGVPGSGSGSGSGSGGSSGSGDSEVSAADEQPGSARSTLPSPSSSMPLAHWAGGAAIVQL